MMYHKLGSLFQTFTPSWSSYAGTKREVSHCQGLAPVACF